MTATLVLSDDAGPVRELTMNRPAAATITEPALAAEQTIAGAQTLDQAGLKDRYAAISERNRRQIRPQPQARSGLSLTARRSRQIRPQNAQLLEVLSRAPLHQQRNETPDPTGAKLRISVSHHSRDLIFGKSSIFLGQTALHAADQSPLFRRHPDIVVASQTPVNRCRQATA